MVSGQEVVGTIGGGALEFDAIAHARKQMEKDKDQIWLRDVKEYPLGPRLGQCCGGHVRLLFERFGGEEIAKVTALVDGGAQYVTRQLISGTPLLASAQSNDAKDIPNVVSAEGEWFLEVANEKPLPIFLYGAGHVGREVVRVFEGLEYEITWIDTGENRFPDPLPNHVQRLVAASPYEAVAYAPDDAFHIVMSYSHPMDLEICHAVLKRGRFRYLGLIGSATKRARFEKRLRELDVDDAALARLVCPIGARGPKGKEPAVIAISLAAEILRLTEAPQDEQVNDQEPDRDRKEQ